MTAATDAATGSLNTLTFNTTSITIDPVDFAGEFIVNHAGTGFGQGGPTAFTLVNTFSYFAGIKQIGVFSFDVDGNGDVSTTSLAATGSGDTLTLTNTTVEIDPGGYTGQFTINWTGTPFAQGPDPSSFVIVPHAGSYLVSLNGPGVIGSFAIDANGQPDPTSIDATVGSENFTFLLSTGLEVEIDIKPGSDPNSINLGSNGVVPVAILSTSTFDATSVDPLTVTLADAGVRIRGKGKPMASQQDVNGDGLMDLVVHVETQALELTENDTEAELQGSTTDGKSIRGVDTVHIVQSLHVEPTQTYTVGVPLNSNMLDAALEQAATHWSSTYDAQLRVADLDGTQLGMASANIVWIDRDAAGYGWSVPGSNGGVDLLSVVTHEIGHILGRDHDDDHDVMASTLAPQTDFATQLFAGVDLNPRLQQVFQPIDSHFEGLLSRDTFSRSVLDQSTLDPAFTQLLADRHDHETVSATLRDGSILEIEEADDLLDEDLLDDLSSAQRISS